MEGPEMDPRINSQPIFDKRVKNTQLEKKSPFNRCGKTGTPYAKE